jgi:DNA-binding PadR family transcriptional regulator
MATRDNSEHLGLTKRSDPSLLILLSLAGGAKHGHALASDIHAMTGLRLGPGTLYGAITRLEERGLIEPMEPEGRRQPYRATQRGLAELADAVAEMRMLSEVGSERLAARTARPVRPAAVPRLAT